jgi:uncharacterized membrane protein
VTIRFTDVIGSTALGERLDPEIAALGRWRQLMAKRYVHPVNQALIDDAPLGARFADAITGFMGSWKFIVVQTIIVTAWLVGNIILLSRPFDPYPFILLNLAFSLQAAYAAPLILLAGNRAAIRDRMTLEHAAAEADVEERQNERLLGGNTEILHHVAALEARILEMEAKILAGLDAAKPSPPEPR